MCLLVAQETLNPTGTPVTHRLSVASRVGRSLLLTLWGSSSVNDRLRPWDTRRPTGRPSGRGGQGPPRGPATPSTPRPEWTPQGLPLQHPRGDEVHLPRRVARLAQALRGEVYGDVVAAEGVQVQGVLVLERQPEGVEGHSWGSRGRGRGAPTGRARGTRVDLLAWGLSGPGPKSTCEALEAEACGPSSSLLRAHARALPRPTSRASGAAPGPGAAGAERGGGGGGGPGKWRRRGGIGGGGWRGQGGDDLERQSVRRLKRSAPSPDDVPPFTFKTLVEGGEAKTCRPRRHAPRTGAPGLLRFPGPGNPLGEERR